MEQPHCGQSGDSPGWPQLEMLGLRTPRPPLVLRHQRLLIGSGAGAQIRLKSAAIDSLHAVLFPSATGCLLRDLASASGSFVNDQPVRQAALRDGDRIRIGPFDFRYADSRPLPPHSPDAPPAAARLEEVGTGQSAILAGSTLLIGSASGCDLVLQDPSVAQRHALLSNFAGRYILQNLGPPGTLSVNGQGIVHQPVRFGARGIPPRRHRSRCPPDRSTPPPPRR